MKKQSGFTIIELMIVVALIGTLSVIAAPNVGEFIRNTRLKSQMFALLNSINVGRTEAIKRRSNVTICRVADPTIATPVCGSSASNTWTTGWIVFEDIDGDGVYETGDGDDIIQRGNPALGEVKIITNSTSDNNLQYKSDGSTNEGGGTARFAICDNRGGSDGRQVNVAPVGRATMQTGSSGSPINCTGPT